MRPWLQSGWLNGTLACAAVALALAPMARPTEDTTVPPPPGNAAHELSLITLADGTRALKDVDGTPAPLVDYQRIASGSTISDPVLLELCDPTRVAAFTTYSGSSSLEGYRYAGKPQVAALKDIEAIVALKPDLLLLNTHVAIAKVQRLREAGITVFNLGEMRGLSTFERNVRQIALLIGQPERGEDYLRAFNRRLHAVTAQLPKEGRKTAIYLSIFGRQFYGGAANTSYSDVLRSAGLVDVAAKKYEGWPRYSTPQLLELNPEFIVLRAGAGKALCALPGADHLQACKNHRAGIIEGPQELWGNPGPGILVAAETLFDRVYGAHAASKTAPGSSSETLDVSGW